ncbi:MAG: glycosyltransferase [Planctomycetia bacterium]|nr:glycosyltransferase [Planctomycetia bacterium]
MRRQQAEYRVGVVRRHNKPEGYKAGNVNYAVDRAVDQPWFIIVDADQILPNTYLAAMAAVVREQPEEVAFVQGGHTADDLALIDSQDNRVESGRRPTPFQRAMGLEVQMFYDRDLTLRQTHGFLPCLGHGVAIRRSAWQAVCGIPHVVSEDFAFAMKLSQQGLYGVYADHVRSWESYPKDFGSFLIRLYKFYAGTAELLKLHLWGFLKSEVPCPKGDGYVAPPLGLSIVMALVGMATIWLALRWRSPFSPVLVAHGCSYFAFVMPGLLDGRGIAWRLTRSLVLLPGSAFVVALVLMWHWGKL